MMMMITIYKFSAYKIMASWEEIETAIAENKHELHLNGDSVSQRLKTAPLPESLFRIHTLNYLEISNTCLAILPDKISLLDNLLNLALHRNEIIEIPENLNQLKKIKFLDLSFNKITTLPMSLELPHLHTFNLGNNHLQSLPNFGSLPALGILFIDHNNLSELPSGLEMLSNLSELYAAKNEISIVPQSLTLMTALKVLDLSENLLKEIAVDLSLCRKMKDLNIKDNPLKDNRLRKMTTQCNTKSILEYIAQHTNTNAQKGKKGKLKKKVDDSIQDDDNEKKIYIMQSKDSKQIISKANVKDVRSYICCVIVRNLDLRDLSVFKKFITLQTKLHENECDMRTKATIATHNAVSLKFPLTYEGVSPNSLEIIPLGQTKKVSSTALIDRLKTERDDLKLKKKRQPKTGLYRYIDLVDGKNQFACLKNADGEVISFPPVTNSEQTKTEAIISDVFIEVTSPLSLPQCKYVLEEVIKNLFLMDFESKQDDQKRGLVLERVSVVDEQGDLKVVFPSKIDLDFSSTIPVVRIDE
ncbi:leucine-rich repeat-containing protein 47 isoform X2 [Hydra vulgaris]|uniref:Leucine-rich repeat-containing protein 47 isoform X2 n=1 Tax=Hydra vulgaris TaxID=6087 RepID=A0ABM4C0E7_HYDVU